MKQTFDADAAKLFWQILTMMVNPPASEQMMDRQCMKFIQEKLAEHQEAPSPVLVWNTFKELIDLAVYGAWLPDTLIMLIDVERSFSAPVGGFARSDASIYQAPWRRVETTSGRIHQLDKKWTDPQEGD